MGKLKQIEIYLANNKTVYHPGDYVDGNIVVESRGTIKINSLKIFIRGIGKVHWTENKAAGYRFGEYIEHYKSEVEYICLEQTIIGGRDNDANEQDLNEFICDGFHVFPFSFILPRVRMASSFEGKHGSIRYFVLVELDKRWGLNCKAKKMFKLINPIDINQIDFLSPVFNECSKEICCWFWTSGPVSINVKTNRRGFYPGESIVLNALFENNSKRSITPVAYLYQMQTYKNSNGKQFISNHKLTTLTGQAISPGSINEWNSKLLKIPHTSPTINSILIKVDYYIKISLLIPGSCTLSCFLPIILGTVPFIGFENINQATTSYHCNDVPPSYSEIHYLNSKEKSVKRIGSSSEQIQMIPPAYSELLNFDKTETELQDKK